MDAVRGLCAARLFSQADASTSHRPSSSSRRLCGSSLSKRGNNVQFCNGGTAPVRRISRKSRRLVLSAVVLADTTAVQAQGVAATASSKSSLKLEECTAAPDSDMVLPDRASISSADLQTELPKAGDSERELLPALGLTDTDLESTLEHRLWTSLFATTAAATLARAFSACHAEAAFLQLAAGVLAGWALADLATGVYHWGVDNYGSASTPLLGAQIDAFQGHHRRPWTITRRAFANNVHAVARPASLLLAPCLLLQLPGGAFADAFLAVFAAMVVLSQHFHALAHMKTSQLPGWVAALQDGGLILGRKKHGAHHRPPYDANYCLVSGVWNDALRDAGVFKRMERAVFATVGVAPRAWGGETQGANAYFEDGSEFDPSQSS